MYEARIKAMRECANDVRYTEEDRDIFSDVADTLEKASKTIDDLQRDTCEWKVCGHFKDHLECTKCYARYSMMKASIFKYCPNCGRKVNGRKQ